MNCKWCGFYEAEEGKDLCPECSRQWKRDNERISQLIVEGHTRHCACRQVWGDGECSCALEKVYDPYWWMKIEPMVPFTTAEEPMIYHMAAKIDQHGNVSALCYDEPKPIPLSKRESWTLRPEAVTCKKCLEKMKKE